MADSEKKAQMKKVNGIFQLNVKGSGKEKGVWTIDFKKVQKKLLTICIEPARIILLVFLTDGVFVCLFVGLCICVDRKVQSTKAQPSLRLTLSSR